MMTIIMMMTFNGRRTFLQAEYILNEILLLTPLARKQDAKRREESKTNIYFMFNNNERSYTHIQERSYVFKTILRYQKGLVDEEQNRTLNREQP